MQQSIFKNFTSQKKVTRSQTNKELVSKQQTTPITEVISKRKQPLNRRKASPTISPDTKKTIKKDSIQLKNISKKSILNDEEKTQELLNFEKINAKQDKPQENNFANITEILQTKKKNSKINEKSKKKQKLMEVESCQDEEKENQNNSKNINNITENQKNMQEEQEQITKPAPKKQTRKNNKKRQIPKDLLDEIAKINEPNQKKEITETQKKADEIINGPSARSKYEELLKDEIQLVLPSKYKDVLTNFSQLDATLEHFINKGRIGHFDDLVCEIDTIYKRNYQIKYLQQIMFISPNSFEVKYTFNAFKRKHQLTVSYPQNEKNINLNQRKQNFRNLLINHTKIQHLEFLKQQNLENYVLQVQNVWNPLFNLDEVTEIPRQPLPYKPNETVVTSVSEHLDVNENNQKKLKNVIVQDIMKTVADKDKQQKEIRQKVLDEAKKIKLEKDQNKSGLSDNIYKMILAKRETQLQQKLKYKQGEAANFNNNIVYMQKIVGILSMYYKNRNVCSMALVQVVEYIQKTDDFSQTDKGQIQSLIDELAEKAPEFITIKNNPLIGKCVVLNKKTEINKVKQKLSEIV